MCVSSQEKVLGTTELLESVLCALDARTLLTSAQLVSREWHSLVAQSPALQRALYFRPGAETPPRGPGARDAHHAADGGLDLNPLLAEAFPIFFRPSRPRRPPAPPAPIVRSSFESLPWAAHPDRSRAAAFMRPGASWRRMLGTRSRPSAAAAAAARGVGLCRRCVTGHGDALYAYDAVDVPPGVDGGGLRMGELYDLVLDCTANVRRGGGGGGAQDCGVRVFWAPEAFLDVLRATARPSAGRPLTAFARELIETWRRTTEGVEMVMEVLEWAEEGCVSRGVRQDPGEAARERVEFERRFRHPEAKQLMALPEDVTHSSQVVPPGQLLTFQ